MCLIDVYNVLSAVGSLDLISVYHPLILLCNHM